MAAERLEEGLLITGIFVGLGCDAGRAGLLLVEERGRCVIGEVRGEDFDSNGAIEPGVPSLVNLTHATCTQRCQDFVGTQL